MDREFCMWRFNTEKFLYKECWVANGRFKDSIFIDCEFINCEYAYVTLGKEYRNCKFNKIKEIEEVSYYDTVVIDSTYMNCKLKSVYYRAKFESVIFKNSTVRLGLGLKNGKSKNIQFVNCLTRFTITGMVEDILVHNSKPDVDARIGFQGGDMKNIMIKDCPLMARFIFSTGTFNNISIINCKDPITRFSRLNLVNLFIKDSVVQHLAFDKSDVNGNNRI